MSPFELLKEDHKKVSAILEQLSETTERAKKTRDELFAKLNLELTAHAQIEEEIFYPALKKSNETREIATEAIEQAASRSASQHKLDHPSQQERDKNGEKRLPSDEFALSHPQSGSEDNQIIWNGNGNSYGFGQHENEDRRYAILDQKHVEAVHSFTLHILFICIIHYLSRPYVIAGEKDYFPGYLACLH